MATWQVISPKWACSSTEIYSNNIFRPVWSLMTVVWCTRELTTLHANNFWDLSVSLTGKASIFCRTLLTSLNVALNTNKSIDRVSYPSIMPLSILYIYYLHENGIFISILYGDFRIRHILHRYIILPWCLARHHAFSSDMKIFIFHERFHASFDGH